MHRTLLAVVAAFVAGFCFARENAEPLKSGVITLKESKVAEAEWGRSQTAFTGETYGVKDMLTTHLVIKPGQEVHPPHQHAEEEFLLCVGGKGTWHLNGKEIEAKKGDVVYVAPWDMHGMKNTSDKDLTVFVVKWGYKGLDAPKKPEPK